MTELVGVPLSVLTEEPDRIAPGVVPVRTIARYEERVRAAYADGHEDLPEDIWRDCHSLSDEALSGFDIVELMKIRASSIFMLRSCEIRERFERDPRYRVFDKIANSMWRWGSGDYREDWNSLVDAYEGMKRLEIGIPDFALALSYTTGNNERGRSEHHPEVYLDGVFGLFIHYKGQHVMTIGFSIASDRRIVLLQVQLRHERGNRFLYKLPKERVEFAIDLLSDCFPGFALHIVLGETSVMRYRTDYGSYRERTLVSLSRNADDLARLAAKEDLADREHERLLRLRDYRVELEKDLAFVDRRLAGLSSEVGARIVATYDRDHGPWRRDLSEVTAMNGIRFVRLTRD